MVGFDMIGYKKTLVEKSWVCGYRRCISNINIRWQKGTVTVKNIKVRI